MEPKAGETYDVRWAVTELADRAAGLEQRWRYYEGDQAEVFMSEKLRRAMGRLGRHYRFNYARTVVDAVLARLNSVGYRTADDTGEANLEELLDAVGWEDLIEEARELALVHGESFLIVWPEAFAELRDDTSLDDDLGPPVDVSIELEPATTMVAAYHARRKSEIRVAARTWLDAGRRYLELYYPDRLERWRELGDRADHYELDPSWEDAGTFTYPDSMPELVPVFKLSTRRTGYGRAEHEDAMGPQTSIDKLVSGLMATIDYAGAPVRWGLMHEGDPTSSAAYDDLEDVDDDTDQEATNGAVTSKLRSGPGEFWLLDLKAVGEFQSANVTTYLEPWAQTVRSMASITKTPIHLFEGFGAGATVSGEAIRSAEAPLVKKVEQRQRTFGSAETGCLEYALALLGIDTVVDVLWAPPAMADDGDAWNTTATKVSVGLPLRQALEEQGYRPELLDDLGITTEDGNVADANTLSMLLSRMSLAVPTILSGQEAKRLIVAALNLDDDVLDMNAIPPTDDAVLVPAAEPDEL